MRPNRRFLNQSQSFWACVRTISQHVGYTVRGKGQVLVPDVAAMARALAENDLDPAVVVSRRGKPTDRGRVLHAYLRYRARVLNERVEPMLMDAGTAKRLFRGLKKELCPGCPLPMNRQKGDKRAEAYLTCLVNMLIEHHCSGYPCDYSPHRLTTVTSNGIPVRTLARRVDGAFPSTVNPVAVWEIKEYYHTTTFGSRVADGIYETLLDGMELSDLRATQGITVRHYLMIDAHYTWWECGRSYLCRIIDTLHMGYVDEVLFGREVVHRLPVLVRQWVRLAGRRDRG